MNESVLDAPSGVSVFASLYGQCQDKSLGLHAKGYDLNLYYSGSSRDRLSFGSIAQIKKYSTYINTLHRALNSKGLTLNVFVDDNVLFKIGSGTKVNRLVEILFGPKVELQLKNLISYVMQTLSRR